MIPLVIPPLTNLRVLVTRPASQAHSFCNQVQKLGGIALGLPVLEVRPREFALRTETYDLLIFVSVNAVTHGLPLLKSQSELNATTPHIAVIGNATATALKQSGYAADIIAAAPFNSEALLKHTALQSPPEKILLIRGVGGRDLLRDTLMKRGATVDIAEVYERVPAQIDAKIRAQISKSLRDDEIDIVTITSVDTLTALESLFEGIDREQLKRVAVIAGSGRIAAQVAKAGWRGTCITSDSPDDATMVKTLIGWHSRGRN